MTPLYKLTIVALFALTTGAFAFHDGGVAACTVCHLMHNNGFIVQPSQQNNYLLRFESATDVCLSCHAAESGAVWAYTPNMPAPERGAGNFVFVSAPNLNDAADSALVPLAGSHGVHNCASVAFNSPPDPNHLIAPGGTYPSSGMTCTSCHDPHGNTDFRMLRGTGFVPSGNFNFVYPAPDAEGLPLDGPAESRTLHTAYKSGWTNWCANCHGRFHDEGRPAFEHPVDEALDSEQRNSYNLYNGTDDPTGGNSLTAYLPQVPFESATMTMNSTDGPGNNARISCITCHRAHGSSAINIGRWDFQVYDLRLDGLLSGSYALPVPYTGTVERSLCVKCHERDTQTHGFDNTCLHCHLYNRGEQFEELVAPRTRKSH